MLIITEVYNKTAEDIQNYITMNNLEHVEYEVEDIVVEAITTILLYKPQGIYGDDLSSEFSNFIEDFANLMQTYYDDQVSTKEDNTDSYDMVYMLSNTFSNLFRFILLNVPEKYYDDCTQVVIHKNDNYYLKINSNSFIKIYSEELDSILVYDDNVPYTTYDYRNNFAIFKTILDEATELEFKLFIEILTMINMENKEEFDRNFLLNCMRNFDRYNKVIDELHNLAYSIPTNVTKNFNGWLGDRLIARILQDDSIQG